MKTSLTCSCEEENLFFPESHRKLVALNLNRYRIISGNLIINVIQLSYVI